jgi:uncharacterized protein
VEKTDYEIIARITSGNTFKDISCSPNIKYFYHVTACRDSNISSENSNEIEIIIPKESEKIVIKFYIGKNKYRINNEQKEMDVAPIIIEGRTLLPIRYAAEALKAKVVWNATEEKITIQFKEILVEIWIGKNLAKVNGIEKQIDSLNPKVKPIIIPPGRTMLPIRFITENLGCKVDWNSINQEITITYND